MPQSHAQLRHQLGLRLQRLRQRHGLTQAELARRLELSPSYLNQIERNQRPLTLAIQQRLKTALGELDGLLDLDDPAALVEPLDESLRSLGHTLLPAELRALTGNLPQVAQALLDLHRAHQHLLERNAALELQIGVEHAAMPSLSPGEQVRDYFNRAHNYLPELDERAEALYAELGLTPENLPLRLRQRLAERHGLLVQDAPKLHRDKRSLDAQARVLWLSAHLRPGQQAFQMAAQLALLECAPLLDARIADAGFADAERIALSRIGLSNYFAGALVMPYSAFLHSAQISRYDIEWLADRFDVGFEAVCHRLSTLQRRGQPVCRSSSCGWTAPAMCPSVTRPPISISRMSAVPARCGSCMRRSTSPTASLPRSRACPTAGAISGWPARSAAVHLGMAARARRLPWPWAATCATPTNWCMRAVGI